MRWIRFSIVPALACLSVAFAVLPRTGGDLTIRMIESADGVIHFDPGDAKVPAGARVQFLNDGKHSHTASCADCEPEGTWSTGVVQPGQDVFVTFPDDGAFTYGDPAAPPENRARLTVGNPPAVPSPSPTASGAPAAT